MSLNIRKVRGLFSARRPKLDLPAQSFDPPERESNIHEGGFIDGIGHDVRSAVSEKYVNLFLAGDTEDEVPLGSERTHCFCDLTFLRWLFVDKLAWNETPLCREHQQLRRRYDAVNLDGVLMRTMDIILTYDIVLDLPELIAASLLWNDDFRSVEKDLATHDGPRDAYIRRKLDDVRYLLLEAHSISYKRKEVQDLSRLTDAYAVAAMFKSYKLEGRFDLEWDFDVSLFIYVLEHRAKTEPMRKAARTPDTLWPTDQYLENLIDRLSTHYSSNVFYQPDFLDRLLRVRPKLEIVEDFDYMADLDDVINMLEEAQVSRFARDFEVDRRSGRSDKKGNPDSEFLSSLLLAQAFGMVQPLSVQGALGYSLQHIDDIAERLVDVLCKYDIDDSLEHIMSTLRRLRHWMNVRRRTLEGQTSTYLPATLQRFVGNLPSIHRYELELRQVTKQRKADMKLLMQGKRALLDENHGREKGGWANDAVAFLVLLNAKATSKTIYPTPEIKRDLDVDHELRIMPPILLSYSTDEVCPSPALYFRMKAAKKLIDNPENAELVAQVQALIDIMELVPEVQSWRESRKQGKQQVMRDDRIRHYRQSEASIILLDGYEFDDDDDDDFKSDKVDQDWRSEKKGWARDMSFLVTLFGRKFAQVPRKADWSILPGVSFLVNKEIKYMLRILLSYDITFMGGLQLWLGSLAKIMERLREYEYVPEWSSLKKLVEKVEAAARFDPTWGTAPWLQKRQHARMRRHERMLLQIEDWSRMQYSDDDDDFEDDDDDEWVGFSAETASRSPFPWSGTQHIKILKYSSYTEVIQTIVQRTRNNHAAPLVAQTPPKPTRATRSPRPPAHQPTIPPPSPEELDATLQSHFDHLVFLLRRKLAQNPDIYRYDADRDNALNHKIKRAMRKISGHPYFRGIENDISEHIFHVTWGRLEAEVARWGGGNTRKDRGRLMAEQETIKRVFGEWKLEIREEKRKYWRGRLINGS
ncbi:hypothetical protein G7Y79_00055g089770 [Physcia stellaris]|nr:hypothetical protein G7Y79_00055g089770 [Physcia stellaris]